ncbi:glycogenin-2 isoform X5 [Macaca fascicularis]|uniref:glycogenin-2 isoform X5 n=1 Tax=Macaca fascicularis TaxID=9541 RepID=UPI0032B07D25
MSKPRNRRLPRGPRRARGGARAWITAPGSSRVSLPGSRGWAPGGARACRQGLQGGGEDPRPRGLGGGGAGLPDRGQSLPSGPPAPALGRGRQSAEEAWKSTRIPGDGASAPRVRSWRGSPPTAPGRSSAGPRPLRAAPRTMSVTDQAFVTLATNDIYCQGALVLGQSLRRHRLTRKLVVLITPQVSSLLRVILSKVFDEVIEVNLIDSADYIHLAFLKRPELGLTLTKLHCWTLTHYSKCVFLDADTLVLSNVDELFDRGEFSAAPDPGWPDCFNSGVFVFQPSLHTHKLLLQHAMEHGSFDGADQGLLNSFFRNWSTADIHKHLPFIYNLSSNTMYTYSPAFKQFGSSAKVVHFLGSTKPWNYKYNPQSGSVLEQGSASSSQHQAVFLHLWWTIYQNNVLPLYKSAQAGEAHASPGHTMIDCPEIETPAVITCDPLSQPSPQLADFTETETTLQPANKVESLPSEEIFEPSQELPAETIRDPSLQDALEVDLAVSVSQISIEEKVKELSPEEERRKWEEGRIDYMGKDAFARIQEKLDRFLQ